MNRDYVQMRVILSVFSLKQFYVQWPPKKHVSEDET